MWTGVNRCEQVLFPVLIILRRSYQNRCEVLFFLEDESHASQIRPTLQQSYRIPLVHFPKALKRPRNNAGPAKCLNNLAKRRGRKVCSQKEMAPFLIPFLPFVWKIWFLFSHFFFSYLYRNSVSSVSEFNGKHSNTQAKICNFSRIGHKTETWQLSKGEKNEIAPRSGKRVNNFPLTEG